MSERIDGRHFLGRWSERKQRAARGRADANNTPSGEGQSVEAIRADALAHSTGAGRVQPHESPYVTDPAKPYALTLPTESVDSPDGGAIDSPVAPLAPDAETVNDDGPGETDEGLLSDADMPPIDSLGADSDLSAFFNKGVSAGLRKAALRHVFRQPAFNVRDGLNDYDGDFTVFEPLGDTVTADMKFHAARKLQAARAADEQAALSSVGGDVSTPEQSDVTESTPAHTAEASDPPAGSGEPQEQAELARPDVESEPRQEAITDDVATTDPARIPTRADESGLDQKQARQTVDEDQPTPSPHGGHSGNGDSPADSADHQTTT